MGKPMRKPKPSNLKTKPMNDLTVKSKSNISPWKQAVQASQTGSFLLFKKGDWTIREEEVSDLEMIANPFEIYYGFNTGGSRRPARCRWSASTSFTCGRAGRISASTIKTSGRRPPTAPPKILGCQPSA